LIELSGVEIIRRSKLGGILSEGGGGGNTPLVNVTVARHVATQSPPVNPPKSEIRDIETIFFEKRLRFCCWKEKKFWIFGRKNQKAHETTSPSTE